jgi:hypothetical protein
MVLPVYRSSLESEGNGMRGRFFHESQTGKPAAQGYRGIIVIVERALSWHHRASYFAKAGSVDIQCNAFPYHACLFSKFHFAATIAVQTTAVDSVRLKTDQAVSRLKQPRQTAKV